jgi:hypothetical protein
MSDTKIVNQFNISPLVIEIENVIQEGLYKILGEHMDRYNLLEKTHKQIMQLPSIREELNRKVSNLDNDSDNDSDSVEYKDAVDNSITIKVTSLENRLDRLEKKYDTIIPVLDKILNKITGLGKDINELQNNNTKNIYISEASHTINVEKSSVIKTSENENIEIHVEEPNKEFVDEEIDESDEEDVNPALITCSTITLNRPDNEAKEMTDETSDEDADEEATEEVSQEEVDEELSVGEELGEHEEFDKKQIDGKTLDKVEQDEEESEKDAEEDVEEESEQDAEEDVEEETDEEVSISTENAIATEVVEVGSKKEATEEVIEDAEEENSIETETKEELDDEDDEEELFEIEIDDKTYCTNDDQNGFIWELTEEGEQGEKIGYLKDGDAFFYEDEN